MKPTVGVNYSKNDYMMKAGNKESICPGLIDKAGFKLPQQGKIIIMEPFAVDFNIVTAICYLGSLADC